MFRELSLAYGWTPEEIAELTIDQLRLYWPVPGASNEQSPLDLQSARELARARRAAKEAWIEAHVRTK